jgi:probable HAF family extracellular repeat protein
MSDKPFFANLEVQYLSKFLILSLVFFFSLASIAGATQYKAVSLGTLGGTSSCAEDINDYGQIVGLSQTSSGVDHAFLWKNDKMIDLGTLGGEYSYAKAINNKGQVVGGSDTVDGSVHAFLWENGKMKDLDPSKAAISYAQDINDNGQVVIDRQDNGPSHTFIWQKNKLTDLGVPAGGITSVPDGINNNGQVIGVGSKAPQVLYPAFVWQKGIFTQMKTKTGDYMQLVYDINDKGQIVGTPSGPKRPGIWDKGTIQDFGTLGGYARGINEKSQVVGFTHFSSGFHAFFWEKGVITDLGVLPGQTSSTAKAINEKGVIVGESGLAIMWVPKH